MAAQSQHRSKSGLGDWFRRLKAKLWTKAAITGAAHKLARARKQRYLRRRAEQLAFALTPVSGEVS